MKVPAEPGGAAAVHRAGSTRERILREVVTLKDATIKQLAAALELHENTVRDHLTRLRSEGRVRHRAVALEGRGRPALHWSAVDEASASPAAGLAISLATALSATTDVPSRAAEMARLAGREWGERVAAEPRTATSLSGAVCEVMREQGFDPGVGEDSTEIVLRRCPLQSAVSAHPQIVCAVHAGLLEGLAAAHGDRAAIELVPRVPAGPCTVRVRESP